MVNKVKTIVSAQTAFFVFRVCVVRTLHFSNWPFQGPCGTYPLYNGRGFLLLKKKTITRREEKKSKTKKDWCNEPLNVLVVFSPVSSTKNLTRLGPAKRGHIVAATCFPSVAKYGNVAARRAKTGNYSETMFVSRTEFFKSRSSSSRISEILHLDFWSSNQHEFGRESVS